VGIVGERGGKKAEDKEGPPEEKNHQSVSNEKEKEKPDTA
jgi:hypothetical protein